MTIWEAECVDLSSWGPDDSSVAPRRVDRDLFETEAEARAALLRWSQGLTRNAPTNTNLNSKHWHCGKFGYSLTELQVRCGTPAKKRGGASRPKKAKDSHDSSSTQQLAVSNGTSGTGSAGGS
jgi:hypothetical protein